MIKSPPSKITFMDRIYNFKKNMHNIKLINDFFKREEQIFTYLGAEVKRVDTGYAEMILPYTERITRAGRILHGGVIMTMLDYTGGLAVMTINDGEDQVTQELKVNFLNPMYKGPFTSSARIVKGGRTAVVVDVEFRDSENTLGAKGLGTWYIIRNRSIDYKDTNSK
ncbi:esterase [Sulfolobales archaeon HS-7]|nr:esterase [Sulfolobales archaeon HS-7]